MNTLDMVFSTHVQSFTVRFEFPVVFTENLLHLTNPVFRESLARSAEPNKRHRFVAFVDGGLAHARPTLGDEIAAYAAEHAEAMEMVGGIVVTPPGEAAKNDLALVRRYQAILMDRKIDRHSYVVAFGGGAVLDAIGFVAATCHRGVRMIRVPTTTLAQNDAGVGVKNGVNLFASKNFMGSFAPPAAVLNDVAMLDTLNERDKRAGLAEAIKVALIRSPDFFEWIEAHVDELRRFERRTMADQIRRCAELHMAHISRGGDPFERGSARPLDFGHWSAHKLETLTNHQLRHGEAVAIGIALDTIYSVGIGLLSAEKGERVLNALESVGFDLWTDALEWTEASGKLCILGGLSDFQEHLGGELTITVLRDLGVGREVHHMNDQEIISAIEQLKARREREHKRSWAEVL